ncbi:hypothetical protein [Paraburkholderia sartisoli]|uniref:Lipoprotein n=1 Tax=Paraburkholderia sartisoli TaxID=83784 RepID=A0A1H4GH14_9BURK|nr:hypothetical protein [Paraburkholderia sartisoli]SEB08797.1 hypothetical protein SAMN05192564_10624 [Paraburkholderia sartisoli]
MKLPCTVLACAWLLAGCADPAARARLGIQDSAVTLTGFGATQDAAAGAPDRQWIDTYAPVTNRRAALASVQHKLDSIPGDDYFHAKAQCWIDAGRDALEAGDQWGFVEEAIGVAAVLSVSMERGTAMPATRPVMRTVVTVRPDLWAIVDVVRHDPAFASCPDAAAPLACAEVGLMQAGHDAWRRSFGKAEARVATAQNLLRASAGTTLACSTQHSSTRATQASDVADAESVKRPAAPVAARRTQSRSGFSGG